MDLVVESLGLLSPEQHARCLLPILLNLAHLYCDRKQFHLAEDLRALLGTLVPQARLARAHGVPEKAEERYRACSVTLTEGLVEALPVVLAMLDLARAATATGTPCSEGKKTRSSGTSCKFPPSRTSRRS